MNLDIFKNLQKDNNNWIQDFMKQLSKCLEGKNREMENEREEDGLYQVIDFTENGVYLQNTKNNKIFEETEMSEELKEQIDPDYILRYKDGEYTIEQELTDDFLDSMVDIQDYKKIQEDFINNSNILEIAPDTRFNVLLHEIEDEFSILSYDNNKTIEVPNALLPYFLDEDTVLYYKDGKFEKDV